MSQESPSKKPGTQPTGIVYADLFLNHDTGGGHPESPARYTAVMNALRGADFADRLQWLQPRAAERAELLGCHNDEYIATAKQDIDDGELYLSTGDTAVSSGSWDAALHAAGGACVAVDAVIGAEVENAFCVLRPPGHHAVHPDIMQHQRGEWGFASSTMRRWRPSMPSNDTASAKS
jgi:acetoin utilization deacetylase AcuC-like enzyme